VTDLIRSIADPEHPNSLEELRVVSVEQIKMGDNHIMVEFTPTVPHCGMSTLIGEHFCNVLRECLLTSCSGLSIRVRLMRSLPQRFKVDIRVKPGSHQSELAG
jgi:metal-sulfur cluster biosynthetic enzyme